MTRTDDVLGTPQLRTDRPWSPLTPATVELSTSANPATQQRLGHRWGDDADAPADEAKSVQRADGFRVAGGQLRYAPAVLLPRSLESFG